ncbi:GNAT family N-acetyltransferase [Hymenobacter metallicola]|uniref:N-acetyltransferase family protein n=1 Tax=Hymenobacter metallicola TaxID=2563114 RepID=A0A4Z0QH97_9BACT|nr:GNAT family N-acetyltransferase [Hymenobacter metallicola]TGE29427.1 N-acetyltransferase family protein [Hymenobacter metallicola]
MHSSLIIGPLLAEHYPAVAAIYAAGIATGNATFATDIPDWATWDQSHLPAARLVALAPDGAVAGWAALTPVSGRCVYRGVAEVSVYVDAAYQGQGVGQALLRQLVQEAEAQGLWTLQAGILRENAASLALHRRLGFRDVGIRERLGQLQGQWRDVCLLERRSAVVGV